MHNLSKSKLIAFRQCPKRLWLEIHHPELREDSADTLASYQIGQQVGAIAQRLYDPKRNGAVIDAQAEGYDAAFARTAQLLQQQQPIFEAGLRTDGALAFADVMLPVSTPDGPAWRMIEVKSATSVKDYHRDDVAVQTHLAQQSGVNLHSVAVACIDSAWIYPGGDDYRGLLKETDLTAEAKSRGDEVRAWLAEAQQIAARETAPEIAVGEQCHTPFECGFCNYCHRDLPQPENPLDWLPRFTGKKRVELAAQGIDDLRNVPDEMLNQQQLLVKRITLAKSVHFDAVGAAEDLSPLTFPAYFLDFETIQFAVPIWAGTRPYQQIPFQFSLHRLDATMQLNQAQFLDLSGNDPSLNFAEALSEACDTEGPIFVYNQAFEAARIKELAIRFPSLAVQLHALLDRLVDLLPIARNRYYHHSQQGSWSIKAVLPAAVPELDYAQLEGIADGNMAMAAYHEAIHPETTETRKHEIRSQLLAYCRLDTFALVRLWQLFSGKDEAGALVDV